MGAGAGYSRFQQGRRRGAGLNFNDAEKLTTAVLYEGYMLYPYRATATKNVQRWNFGTLYPRDYAVMQRPAESFRMVAACLLEAETDARLDVRARFLHLVRKQGDASKEWDEGVERSYDLKCLLLRDLLTESLQHDFSFSQLDVVTNENAHTCPVPKRIAGRLILKAETLQPGLHKLSIELLNVTPTVAPDSAPRNEAVLQAFVSAHCLLGVESGEFISLLDTPEEFRDAAVNCHNVGVFPVLVGPDSQKSMMLCSPIILYDYPQIAPESAGDFFDGTEMDEMLALRVLTLTEEEKQEMRGGDERARKILERTESLPEDFLMKVHGAIRGMRPVGDRLPDELEFGKWDPLAETPVAESARVSGIEVKAGDRVLLRPRKMADIMDMALDGKVAVIESIEQDFEDNIQLAVVLDDDPGREFGMMRQTGHRFFFAPEEVELYRGAERPENA
jgi:hypothetical protein